MTVGSASVPAIGARAQAAARRPWGPQVLIAVLLALGLLWPAAVNRMPFLYADSAGYQRSGEAALQVAEHKLARREGAGGHAGQAAQAQPSLEQIDRRGDGVSTERSVYYGLFIYPLYRLGGAWLVAAVQALALAITVLVAMQAFAVGPRAQAAALAGLVLFSGLPVFAGALMPDVFFGAMLLAMAVILAKAGRLSPPALTWLMGVTLAALLFHRAHVLIGLATLALATVALALRGALKGRQPWLAALAGLCLAAGAAHVAVDVAVKDLTGSPPVSIPFLLARTVGDGTATAYLRRHCPQDGFATCRYLGHMPMSENDFIWSHDPRRGAFGIADKAQREQIGREANQIVVHAVLEHPLAQAQASALNALRQLVTVGAEEFRNFGNLDPSVAPGFRGALTAYHASGVARGGALLTVCSGLMLAAYLLSAAALTAWAAAPRWRAKAVPRPDGLIDAVLVVACGLLANAAVNGVLSGVFDRYQGRAAWLLPLFAVMALVPAARPAK